MVGRRAVAPLVMAALALAGCAAPDEVSADPVDVPVAPLESVEEPADDPIADDPALPFRTERTITIVDRPGSAQSNIVLANPGIKRTHPDYFPMLVMNQVLGAGAVMPGMALSCARLKPSIATAE